MTVVESVYSAVRTDSLHKADYASSLKGYTFNLRSLRGQRHLASKGKERNAIKILPVVLVGFLKVKFFLSTP
jgi:hypothetical protein